METGYSSQQTRQLSTEISNKVFNGVKPTYEDVSRDEFYLSACGLSRTPTNASVLLYGRAVLNVCLVAKKIGNMLLILQFAFVALCTLCKLESAYKSMLLYFLCTNP